MTGTQELTDFVDALDDLIDSASSCVRDPDEFLEINRKISNLVETSLPPIVEALDAGNLAPLLQEHHDHVHRRGGFAAATFLITDDDHMGTF